MIWICIQFAIIAKQSINKYITLIKIIEPYKQMTHTKQSFLIPQLNIVANDSQLKKLQKNMLINHYEQQSQQKMQRSQSEKKNYFNYYNPQTRADTQIQYDYMKNSIAYNRSFQRDLADFYQQEITRKQTLRKRARQIQRKQQEQMIKQAQKQLYRDKIRAQQFTQSFKRQAQQSLQAKQRKKSQQKAQQQSQKQAFQRRYSTNLLSLNKQQSFRKHYLNVSSSIHQNEQNYLTKVAPLNQQKQLQKQLLISSSIRQSQSKLRQQLQKQFTLAEKHRAQLRDSLVEQIREKEERKKAEIEEIRSKGYTEDRYKDRHHPINNPVDFRIGHDNRYVIGELRIGGRRE